MTFIMGSWTLGAALLFSAIKNISLLELIKGEENQGQPPSIVEAAYNEAGAGSTGVEPLESKTTRQGSGRKGAAVKTAGKKLTAAQYAGHPQTLKPGIEGVVATILQHFPKLIITATSDGNHATNSYHYKNRAVDLASGDYAYMNEAAAWIKAHLTTKLTEGIHNPNLSVKYRVPVPSSYWGSETWAGHANHIHVAV